MSDSAAIQAQINAASGICTIAPGAYVLDAGLNLHSDLTLVLEGVTLSFPVNVSPRCWALQIPPGCSNILIRGGELIGSRSPVVGLQWAIGLRIDSSAFVTVSGLTCRDWFFDGIWIGGNQPSRSIAIDSALVTGCRRNGLSITNASAVSVVDSTFSGCSGQDPQSGCDVESNPGEQVQGLVIRNCTFSGNSGVGLYLHAGKGSPAEDVRIVSCQALGNAKYGIVLTEAQQARIYDCRVDSSPTGISLGGGAARITVAGNLVTNCPKALVLAGVSAARVVDNAVPHVEMPTNGVSGDCFLVDNQ